MMTSSPEDRSANVSGTPDPSSHCPDNPTANPSLDSTSGSRAGVPRARARFLAQSIRLEEAKPPGVMRGAIYVCCSFLIAGVLWASVTEINEVAVAKGEVVPSGLIHSIQHLEGGIVESVTVRNGDTVAAGELLVSLSPQAYQSDLGEMKARQISFSLQLERLQALIEERAPRLEKVTDGYPALLREQLAAYESQRESRQHELAVLESQTQQRDTELARQKNLADATRREVDLLREQLNLHEKLRESRAVSELRLLELASNLAEEESEYSRQLDSVAVSERALQEARQRGRELLSKSKADLRVEASNVLSRLTETEQSLIRLADRVNRLEIRSPIAGVVESLTVTNANAVVRPGEEIMKIVPVQDELLIEAKISTVDVGHLHPGQAAQVKIDSYDAFRFGTVPGKLVRISASTYLDTDKTPYYQAEITLERGYVGSASESFHVIPGMTVVADIKTGKKTILSYLLKPISRGFSQSFRER